MFCRQCNVDVNRLKIKQHLNDLHTDRYMQCDHPDQTVTKKKVKKFARQAEWFYFKHNDDPERRAAFEVYLDRELMRPDGSAATPEPFLAAERERKRTEKLKRETRKKKKRAKAKAKGEEADKLGEGQAEGDDEKEIENLKIRALKARPLP